eukprot:COSAG05_NODE_8_length_40675_cov_148.837539_38_plen_116_part_00
MFYKLRIILKRTRATRTLLARNWLAHSTEIYPNIIHTARIKTVCKYQACMFYTVELIVHTQSIVIIKAPRQIRQSAAGGCVASWHTGGADGAGRQALRPGRSISKQKSIAYLNRR